MSKKILRFTASYCQPCKILAKNLETANLGIPVEVVDIEVYPELAEQYLIRSVPTLVLIDSNKEVARMVGLKPVEQIKDWATVN